MSYRRRGTTPKIKSMRPCRLRLFLRRDRLLLITFFRRRMMRYILYILIYFIVGTYLDLSTYRFDREQFIIITAADRIFIGLIMATAIVAYDH